MERCVIHVDLDCFYVQVEVRDKPSLEGLPVAVVQYNQWQGGGIIALSYEAKAAGVKRSMRGDEAKKKCPGIVLVPVRVANEKADLTRYRRAGSEVFAECAKFGTIERTSIDEAYLDLTAAAKNLLERHGADECLKRATASKTFVIGDNLSREDALLAAGALVCGDLRQSAFSRTGFTLSAGISRNKMLSKLVSGRNKPNKQTVLPERAIAGLLRDLPLRDMNGFGGKLGDRLIDVHGVQKVGELLAYSLPSLIQLTEGSDAVRSNQGQFMYNACRGIDHETVKQRLAPKSISAGKTFRGKTSLKTLDEVVRYARLLCVEIEERVADLLREHHKRPTQLTISWHTGEIEVKRKGVAIKLTGQGSSQSIKYPSKRDGLGDAVEKALGQIVASLGNRWEVTCLYIGASGLVDVAKENERIDSFFEKGGSMPLLAPPPPKKKAPKRERKRGRIEAMMDGSLQQQQQQKRGPLASAAGIDSEWLAALPEDIRCEVLESAAAARTSELDARDRAAITSVDQIDMDVLNELPDDLKKEVLANARAREPKRKGGKTRGAMDRFFAK